MSRNAHSYRQIKWVGPWLLGLPGLFLAFCLAQGADSAPQRTSLLEPRSRVVIVQDPAATQAFEPRVPVLVSMVSKAITDLTSKPTVSAAWRSIISTQDTVGIKVYSSPGQRSGTRPGVVAAVVESLIAAGIPPGRIVVWDKLRDDLVRAGFFQLSARYGIRVEASSEAGYNEKTFYESSMLGHASEGDMDYGKRTTTTGRKSFVSKLLIKDITKVINITPMLNNYHVGVTGNLYSMAMGSVDNTGRFESSTAALIQAVPEIYALEAVGDRVVLNIVDALICQYEGGDVSYLQYSSILNELRFSTDPVALDVLSLLELDRQRKSSSSKAYSMTRVLELYQNASLVDLGISDPANIHVERIRPAH